MRILRIELLGSLHATSREIKLDDSAFQTRLFKELNQVAPEIEAMIRTKAAVYLPRDHTVFSRIAFDADGNRANVVIWIDDPAIPGISGLLARRAWPISVPILSHVVRDAVAERLRTLAIEVDETQARVSTFAPTHGWRNPALIAIATTLAVSFYWLYLHDAVASLLQRLLGG